MRAVQTIALDKHIPISFEMIEQVIKAVGDFGEFTGAYESRKRKDGYYGGDAWRNRSQDLRARGLRCDKE